MSESGQVTALLEAAADRMGAAEPPDVGSLVRAATRRTRRRRVATVGGAAALVAALVVALIASPSAKTAQHVTTGGEGNPVIGATAAQLATYVWSDLPPPPTQVHSPLAVAWTGHELLVWDGAGARYDPETGRWRPMAKGPITPLEVPFTWWTGKELLIIGAGGPSEDEAYNPDTDRWRLLAPRPAASGRILGGVWTGSEAIVVTDTQSLAYDAARDRWQTLPALPQPADRDVFGFVPVWTGHEMLAWVSWQRNTVGLDQNFLGIDLLRLDPATEKWTTLSQPADRPAGISSAIWTGSRVTLPGTQQFCGNTSCPYMPARHGYTYDPATNKYTSMTLGPVDDGVGGATWTDGALVRISNSSEEGPDVHLEPNDFAAWDPVANSWVSLPRAPSSVSYETQFVWADGELLGIGPAGAVRFAPAVQTATTASSIPPSASTTSATPLAPPCTSVAVTFEGSEGATQSVFGGFWVRDTGPSPCLLHGDLQVDLIDGSGQTLKSLSRAASAGTPLLLQPEPAEPPIGAPTPGMASFGLVWHTQDPTVGGANCTTPPMVPTAIRVNLDDGLTVTVAANPRDGTVGIAACGGDVGIALPLQPLG